MNNLKPLIANHAWNEFNAQVQNLVQRPARYLVQRQVRTHVWEHVWEHVRDKINE